MFSGSSGSFSGISESKAADWVTLKQVSVGSIRMGRLFDDESLYRGQNASQILKLRKKHYFRHSSRQFIYDYRHLPSNKGSLRL